MTFNIRNLLINNNKSNNTSLIVVFVIITFFTVFTSWYLLSGDDDITEIDYENDDDDTTPESNSKQDNTDSTNTCDASIAPTNGGVGDCTSTLASGSTCIPTCDTGYTAWSPDGSNTTSCHLGNLTSALCLPNACNASTPPDYGGVGDCTSELASGSTCTPACNPGYKLSGKTSCSFGVLTPSTCKPKSCNARHPQPVSDNPGTDTAEGKLSGRWWSGIGNCGYDLPSGESCTQTCPSGYTMPGKSTCLNGEMTYSICKPSSCTIDPNDKDTARVGVDYTNCDAELAHGGTCTPTCLDGYTLSKDRKTVSCSYGQLTIDTECISDSCDPPSKPDNGKLGTCANITTTKMNSGVTCDFECDNGYTLTAPATESITGQTKCYLGVLAKQTCEPSSCDASTPPDNGVVGNCTSELAHNDACTPICNDGYTLSGKTSCSLGVLTKAECLPDPCTMKDPTHGDAGTDCPTELAHDGTCTPTCDDGYTLSGKTSCSAGTLTLASCEPSTCDASSATKNTSVNCPPELASDDSCTPTCASGYTRSGITKCYLGDLIKVATCFLYQYEFIMKIQTSVVGPRIEYIEIDGELLTKDQTFLHKTPNNSDNMFNRDTDYSSWNTSYDVDDKIFTIGSDKQIEKIKIVYYQPQYVPGWIIKENGTTKITDEFNGGDVKYPEHVEYTYDITNGTSTTDTPPSRWILHEKTKFKNDVTNIWIDAGLPTNANPKIDRSNKFNTVTDNSATARTTLWEINTCKTQCDIMDKCKSIIYSPENNRTCSFSGVEANSDNIEENKNTNYLRKTHIYEIERPKGESCDASAVPTNAIDAGTCTSVLEDRDTCTPTCDTGYTLWGDTSCDDGTLTQGRCYKKSEYGDKFGIVDKLYVNSETGETEATKSESKVIGTVTDCKNVCDSWENCVGFSRDQQTNTTMCFLSSGVLTDISESSWQKYYYKKDKIDLEVDPNDVTYTKHEYREINKNYSLDKDTGYVGYSSRHNSEVDVRNREVGCMWECSIRPECEAVDWNYKKSECNLYGLGSSSGIDWEGDHYAYTKN